MHNFLNFQGHGSKIEFATPFASLSFEISKWAWQAQFLSHTSVTFKDYVFFTDVQMILLLYFDISNQK